MSTTEPQAPLPELMSFVRSVSRLSGRVAGSQGERQAQELLAGRLARMGFEVVVEGAVCPPQPPAVLALHASCGLLAVLLVLVSPLWGLALGTLTGLSFWGELRGGPYLLHRLLLKRISGNLVARLRPAQHRDGPSDADQRAVPKIVLVAHADVASSSTLFRPWVRRLWEGVSGEGEATPPRLRLHPGAVVLLASAAHGVAALGALVGAPSLVLHLLLGFAALVYAGLAVLAVDWWRSPPVEGAIDNASGMAVLLGVAADVVDRPLEHAEVWVVGTGDREPDAGGMEAFLFQFGALLDPHNVAIVNVDDVGRGTLHVGTSEGRWDRLPYRPLVAGLAERIARSQRYGTVPLASLFGTTDAGPATRAGFSAVTLTSLVDGRAPDELHTHADRFARVEPQALATAWGFTRELVRALDAELAPGGPRGARAFDRPEGDDGAATARDTP